MKMELIEGSETSAYINQTPGNYPKGNLLYSVHGESLRSRNNLFMNLATESAKSVDVASGCFVVQSSRIGGSTSILNYGYHDLF